MATELYLAMSSDEFATTVSPPYKTGWFDCCFSLSGPGLDCLPTSLPTESLLILTDRFSFRNHDPNRITEELYQTVNTLTCSGVLLDFEKPEQKDLSYLARKLAASLPCPVAVSELYARDMDCPVFLSPCPHHLPLSNHIAPWIGRQIWLDLAQDTEVIEVTSSGTVVSVIPRSNIQYIEHGDPRLHCHYHIETAESCIRFTLRRTKEDLIALLQEAADLGVPNCISLYQEWK